MGTIYQINIKHRANGERGMPKVPVPSVIVTKSGCEGDFNRYRSERMNNNQENAIMILPIELIEQLQREGWPVQPGDLGENFTTKDCPYNYFSIGLKYTIGELVIEISKPCTPCMRLEVLPYVGEKKKEFAKTLVNRRGWYAKVIKEGTVKKGDSITAV